MKSLLKDGDASFGGAIYNFVQVADVMFNYDGLTPLILLYTSLINLF